MVAGGFAQSSSHFQSVGEDYGKTLIGALKTTNAEPAAASNKSSLWSWGSSPKGTSILEGSLVGDPKYSMKKLNVVDNWLGDSLVDQYGSTPAYSYTDPVTGAPVKTYVDPNTGQYYYTYIDSTSKKPVYVYFNPETGVPFNASFTPPAGANAAMVSNDPWSQTL